MFNAKELDRIISDWSEDLSTKHQPSAGFLSPSGKEKAGQLAIMDGELLLKRPNLQGPWPVLVPTESVKVTYNQEPMYRPFVVEDITHLQIKPIAQPPKSEFQLVVSQDKMEVRLETEFTKGKEYQLCDTGYRQKLVVKAELARHILPDAIDPGLVLSELKTMGIKGEILHDQINLACSALTSMDVVVAKGKPATDPIDGKVDIVCELKPRPVISDDDERVDYREKKVINSVEPGDVLAYWQPPVHGKPGVNVFGEPVQPRKPKHRRFLAGSGVRLVNDGRIAVAEITGRPSFERGQLTVRPQLVVSGDVDLRTGNVDFRGDVLILGNVMESLTVKAGGSVEIMGNVYHAQITAGADVVIHKNLIGGKVLAGGNQVVYTQLISLLEQICPELKKLEQAFEQLKNHPSFCTKDLKVRGDGYLLKLILELRFENIPKLFTELRSILSQLDREDPVLDRMTILLKSISRLFIDAGPLNIQSVSRVAQCRECLTELKEAYSELLGEPAHVQVNYCHCARIKTTGSIIVTGRLAYDCQMFAGTNIEINGMCRMGIYNAKESIKVRRAGSRGSATTRLIVAEGGWIGAELFHQDVQLQIGLACTATQLEHKWCRVYYNEGTWIKRNLN